ncbi:CD4-2 molecule, tandem duplicate 2 isoform X2 [Megalops cyprinoides]|uniref:CD4-2 molecule, tandem duplicate 2 isoform X2 n=1 Tax=Megalops cyprinoides TaxID=118141 RepID=UPI0018654758|nr:CD4-2 molecule, tandem duplicate 2 isoform X2 [Megalops cyprinoides]
MPNRQTWLWSVFVSLTVLCLASVKCKVFYVELGTPVTLDCYDRPVVTEVEWMHETERILKGSLNDGKWYKGSSPVASRARLIGGSLHIKNVERADSGLYRCNAVIKSMEHKLYVVTVSSSPSGPFLESSKVELRCQIGGGSTIKPAWLRPKDKIAVMSEEGSHTLHSVALSDEGEWVCQIKDEEITEVGLKITVLGIMPSSNLTVNETDSVLLPCVLSSPLSKYVYKGFQFQEGGWEKISPESVHLLSLWMEGSELCWNTTGVRKKELQFSSKKLGTNLSLTLNNVKMQHAGQYQCSLKFKDKEALKFQVSLEVKGNGSIKGPMFGLNLWLWVAIGVGSLVVMSLVTTVVCLYHRHKIMKKRRRQKQRSLRQRLTDRDYCQCNRSARGQPNGSQKSTCNKGHQL